MVTGVYQRQDREEAVEHTGALVLACVSERTVPETVDQVVVGEEGVDVDDDHSEESSQYQLLLIVSDGLDDIPEGVEPVLGKKQQFTMMSKRDMQ